MLDLFNHQETIATLLWSIDMIVKEIIGKIIKC